jgi:hypothetical protein
MDLNVILSLGFSFHNPSPPLPCVSVEESAVVQVQGGSEAAVRMDGGSGECVLPLDGSTTFR